MSIYNEDEFTPPKWLNKDFIIEVLQRDHHQDEIELLDMQMSPACMKGDHYASIMFRVLTEYKIFSNNIVQRKSLIVKTLPEEDCTKNEFLADLKIFETEIIMYTEILPLIESILVKHGDNTSFGPRAFYASLKPQKVLILEDLCEQGYNTVRGRTFTSKELKMAYLKLAKLHAVSFYLAKTKEHSAKVIKLQDGLFSNERLLKNDFIRDGLPKFIKLLEKLGAPMNVFAAKIRDMEPKVFEACFNLFQSYTKGTKNEIFVLNHGDFHMRNLMVKHNETEEKVEDIMMVDFQMSVFAPSSVDIIYSNFMLMDAETRDLSKRNELLQYYFVQFIDTLKLIGYSGDMPKYSQMQISLIEHRHFALFLMSTFLPMVYAIIDITPEELKDLDMDRAFDNKNKEEADKLLGVFYTNPSFVSELKKLLPEYMNAGYLD